MDDRKNRADASPGALRENSQAMDEDAKNLKELCFDWRKDIEVLKDRIKKIIVNHPSCRLTYEPQVMSSEYEVMDNIVTAYRALEDARMRLGKVVQALDGGTSVYER